jgi:hypothetical protein
VTRRHHFSERGLPLRQPPAERSFSLTPRIKNPVRNDRVLPHLRPVYPEKPFFIDSAPNAIDFSREILDG